MDREVSGELRAEAARRNLSRADLEDRTGIKRTRLRETVYASERSLLISELEILCDVLGLTMSDVVARAEAAVSGRGGMLRAAEGRDGSDEADYDA